MDTQRSGSDIIGPLTLDPSVRQMSEGLTLLGGSPFRIVRLQPCNRELLNHSIDGAIEASSHERSLLGALIDNGFLHPTPSVNAGSLGNIDVVIPCHNQSASLHRLLAGLPVSEFASVTVVDDGSFYPINDLPSEVTLVRHDKPLGPAAARQVGWELGAARQVLFIDADIRCEGTWIETLVNWIGVADVAVVAPRVLTDSTGTGVSRYERHRSPFDLGPTAGMVRQRSRLPFLPTAVLLVARKALTEVGGFQVDMAGGEDVDLVWRIIDAGWRVRYEPSVSVWHYPRRSWWQLSRQRWSYGQSNARLAERHPIAVTPLEISPYSAAAWAFVPLGPLGAVIGAAIAWISTILFTPHLRGLVEDPSKLSLEIAGRGNLTAGEAVAAAIRRSWLPAWVVGSVVSKRIRWVTLTAMILPPILEWFRQRPHIKLGPWIAQRILDDVSFSAGVWRGAIRHRSIAAMVPRSVKVGQLVMTAEDLR